MRLEEPIRFRRTTSIVVRAAQVVATVGADELAAMADQPMGASGADLAMMVDGLLIVNRAVRTAL